MTHGSEVDPHTGAAGSVVADRDAARSAGAQSRLTLQQLSERTRGLLGHRREAPPPRVLAARAIDELRSFPRRASVPRSRPVARKGTTG